MPGIPRYTLYYSPGAASMVVHLALLEIGVPYERVLVDFDSKAQHDPGYLELNPHGVVPTLLIDGRPFVESVALLLMLTERHPESNLAPAPGSEHRNAFYQWTAYLGNTLGANYRFWFYPGDLGENEHTPRARAALLRNIERVWDRLEVHLAAAGPYLLGDRFSVADLQLTMYMRWSRKMPRTALEWPSLKILADQVRARDSWKKLYEIEGLIEW